jgi:hypothetical protein
MWKTAKDWGLLGNMAWAAIAAGISALLPFIAKFLPFLNTSITVAIPVYLLIILPSLASIIYISLVKFYNNSSRIHGKFFGYYRSKLELICFPYNRAENGSFIAMNIVVMEFVITRNDITTIGPYVNYAYKPRSTGGVEEIVRPTIQCWVNGQANELCELNQTNSTGNDKKDKLRTTIRTPIPFKVGDVVKIELHYEISGQHAAYREELNDYLSKEDADKNDYRFRNQKRVFAEMMYGFVRPSAYLSVKVIFPEKFPWRHLDNFEDIFLLSIGTRTIEKRAVGKVVKISSTATSIDVKFPKGIGIDHGFYIFWMVPTKKELVAAGFATDSIEKQN